MISAPLAAWVMLALASTLFVEVLLRLRFFSSLARYRAIASKAYRVVAARQISEHWKEKVLPTYSRQLLVCSAELFGKIVMATLPGFAIGFALTALGIDFLALASSGVGLAFATLVGLLFALVRARHERHPI